MATLMTLLVSLGIDAGDFQKGIANAEKSADSFSAKMSNIGQQMSKIGGNMTLGLTLPIAAFASSAVKSAMDSESAIADLKAVLASTGGAAGVTLDELTGNATALQKVTKFSDEAVMSAQGMLLTFTNIGKDTFPDATMTALDMAEKFGTDASQAAITLGKALNDPVEGVGALQRMGVQLTDQQADQIKSFMAVGDIASAQKVIMDELAVEIGGVALAAGATSEGKMIELLNQFDSMKESIGMALIPALLNLGAAILPLIEKFAAMDPAMLNTIIAVIGFVAAAGPVVTVVGGISSAIGFLVPIISGLFTFITATAIPAIFAFIAANILWLAPLLLIIATVGLVYLAFKNNFGGITTTVKNLWGIIQWAFGNIVTAIGNLIRKIGELAAKFLGIKLPAALTPGSPTPFEMGLRGINSAMSSLSSKQLPSLQAGLDLTPNVAGIGNMSAGGGGGGDRNVTNIINVTNPKAETSEESVRKSLKSLSYLGVAA